MKVEIKFEANLGETQDLEMVRKNLSGYRSKSRDS